MHRKGPLVTFATILFGISALWLRSEDPAVLLPIDSAADRQAQLRIATIEGQFGQAEVDVIAPSLVRLCLRGASGLSGQSVLTPSGAKSWARDGYTYVAGQDGRRYESRLTKPDKVDVSGEGRGAVVQIKGVKLATGAGKEPVAVEDWTLSAPGDGSQLVWKIVRRWQVDFTSVMAGSPALFFSFNALVLKNSTTSTIWYDPLRLEARPSDLYAIQLLSPCPGQVSDNLVQTVRDRDTWAIYKLWTNWHAPADLRLEVQGGHLYRRGCYASLGEAGAVTARGAAETHRKGQIEEIALKISAVDKQTTGYQLVVTLPDKATEASLKEFYSSVLNGGAVNDQKGFDFGNESDGWYYAGSSSMHGLALAAGIPASGPLSSHPYDAAQALREHLAHILSVIDERGVEHFGYNQNGVDVEADLHTIIGMHAYLLHTGDLAFVRQSLPALERMLEYFLKRCNDRGLFVLGGASAHRNDGTAITSGLWYYDNIITSGINGYYNAFFYKACDDLADMEAAADRQGKAGAYRAAAHRIKQSFNEVLWKEDAPGGPRYRDWIDAQGKEVDYFCDLCQWPPVAMGIASPEQARKIVATADARLAQLEKANGYQGFAGLSALWPVPAALDKIGERFGDCLNGGSLLSQTYWEIVARAWAGDNEGAARRLRLFAQRAAETSWAGDNAANIKGQMAGGDGEPYLADMVVTPAAVIYGVMGIAPTWEHLEVTPHLPAGWPRAEADILYKGRRHHVVIDNDKVQVQPLEQVIDLPLMWTMDFNLRTAPGGLAIRSRMDSIGEWGGATNWRAIPEQRSAPVISNVDFIGPYGSSVALQLSAATGTYQSPPNDWGVLARLTELTVTVDLHGGQGTVTVETSNDAFRKVSSSGPIELQDGVNTYPLGAGAKPAQMVRLRFELVRGPDPVAPPVIDGFQLLATEK